MSAARWIRSASGGLTRVLNRFVNLRSASRRFVALARSSKAPGSGPLLGPPPPCPGNDSCTG